MLWEAIRSTRITNNAVDLMASTGYYHDFSTASAGTLGAHMHGN